MANVPAPKKVQDVDTPCLLVDLDIVEANCKRMVKTCEKFGVKLRPMMKTHKTLEIAEIMTEGSKRCIEGSTLKECEFYADGGFDDILCTIIFTEEKIPRMKALAGRLESFHVMLDSPYGLELLERHPLPQGPWSVYLMVNVGGNRSGVPWDGDRGLEMALALQASKAVSFQGLYGHEGGATYAANKTEEIHALSDDCATRILALAKRLNDAGVETPVVGLGSTPSCSQPGQKMHGINEFHPGNFCFYDTMQVARGSCGTGDIAARVATRVTGHYPETNQLLVDAGFLAVSHDGPGAFGDRGSYCLIQGHPELRMAKMDQETGYVKPVGSASMDFSKYPVGSLLFLLPWHSCATACAYDKYLVHCNEDIVDTWTPCTGW